MSKGSRVKSQKEAKQQAALQAQAQEAEQQQKAEADKPKYSAFTNPKNINWVILSGAMAAMVIVLMFMPQQLGAGITSVYSIMLWTGLFGLTLFRYFGKKGMTGFFTGSVAGMLLHIFAPVLQSL